jgi:hypothetical protein
VSSPLTQAVISAAWPSSQLSTIGDDEDNHLDSEPLAPLSSTESESVVLLHRQSPRWSPRDDGRVWSTIISYRWRRQEHINSLEMRAAILAIRWALSCADSMESRILLFVDSAVAYFIMRKGRSSSSHLNVTQRRLAAHTLATGLSIVPCWVPSANNPADEPSRCLS